MGVDGARPSGPPRAALSTPMRHLQAYALSPPRPPRLDRGYWWSLADKRFDRGLMEA